MDVKRQGLAAVMQAAGPKVVAVGEAVAEEAEERLVHAIGDTEDIPVAMVATVLVVIMGKARLAAKMVALAGTSAVDSAVEGRRRSRTVAVKTEAACVVITLLSHAEMRSVYVMAEIIMLI